MTRVERKEFGMKITKSAIKGGVYRLEKQNHSGITGFFLVIGGTSGLRSGTSDNRQDVSCFMINAKRYGKYDIPIALSSGKVSWVSPIAIYSYPLEKFTMSELIGTITDSAYCTAREFIDMAFGIYQYCIGMSDIDASNILDEYIENFHVEIKEDVEEESEKKSHDSFYNAAMQDAFRKLGPSEVLEQMNKDTHDTDQLAFAKAVMAANTAKEQEVTTPKAAKRKCPKKHTPNMEPRPISKKDDLYQFMVEFKTNVFDKVHGKGMLNDDKFINSFIPVYDLCAAEKRIGEFATVLGYSSIRPLYVLRHRIRSNSAAKV